MAVDTRRRARVRAKRTDSRQQSCKAPSSPSQNKTDEHQGGPKDFLDLPAEIRTTIFELCVAVPGPVAMMHRPKPDMPGLLGVNRQTRDETLPIFYGNNEFHFEECHANFITKWLFNGVQPKHLKFIESISWTASWEETSGGHVTKLGRWPLDEVRIYSEALQEQSIHLSSVIMLLELGLLGKCKVMMKLYNDPRLHVACTLRELVKKQITRKDLTEVHAWNEQSVPGGDDVAGLSYAVSREWGEMLPRVFQRGGATARAHAPEVYCPSCLPDYTPHYRNRRYTFEKIRLPWIARDEAAMYSD